jgi:hypothetical protein
MSYSESQLDEFIDVMEHRFVLPPPDARVAVLQLIERRRVTALIEANYDQAGAQEKLRESFRISPQLEEEQLSEDHRVDALFQRWQSLRRQEQEISERWDSRIDRLIADEREKAEVTHARHQQEQNDFAERWKNPATLVAFTKASARLLQLREQERAMAVARLYAQAKEMKSFADQVQHDETVAAQLRIREQMDADKRTMLKRQEDERQAIETHRTALVNSYLIEKNEELRPIVTAIAQIRAKRPSANSGRVSALATERNQRDVACATPRTQQRYAAFKAEKKVAKLKVKPVDEEQSKSRALTQQATPAVEEQHQPAQEQQPAEQEQIEPQLVIGDVVKDAVDFTGDQEAQEQLGDILRNTIEPLAAGVAVVSGD